MTEVPSTDTSWQRPSRRKSGVPMMTNSTAKSRNGKSVFNRVVTIALFDLTFSVHGCELWNCPFVPLDRDCELKLGTTHCSPEVRAPRTHLICKKYAELRRGRWGRPCRCLPALHTEDQVLSDPLSEHKRNPKSGRLRRLDAPTNKTHSSGSFVLKRTCCWIHIDCTIAMTTMIWQAAPGI